MKFLILQFSPVSYSIFIVYLISNTVFSNILRYVLALRKLAKFHKLKKAVPLHAMEALGEEEV
jgi:hypothetical protein